MPVAFDDGTTSPDAQEAAGLDLAVLSGRRAAGHVKVVRYQLSPAHVAYALVTDAPGEIPFRVEAPSQYLLELCNEHQRQNTAKARASDLALYFGWLHARGICFSDVTPLLLADFAVALKTVPKGMPLSSKVRVLRADRRQRQPMTIRRTLTSVRLFYAWAASVHRVPRSRADALAGVRGPRGRTKASVDRLSCAEVREAFKQSSADARLTFLLGLGYEAGLRLSECLALCFQDIHMGQDSSALGCRIAGPHLHVTLHEDLPEGVFHKSIDPGVVPMSPSLIDRFVTWIDYRSSRLGDDDPSRFVFVSLRGPQRGSAWTFGAAEKSLWRFAQSLNFVGFHHHQLRHTFASELADHEVDPAVLQQLLRHRRIESTAVYVHAANTRLVDAVHKVHDARKDLWS